MANSSPTRTQDRQLASLLETVERLRKDKYPHLSEALVREILTLHADPGAAEGDIARGVEQGVERYINSKD